MMEFKWINETLFLVRPTCNPTHTYTHTTNLGRYYTEVSALTFSTWPKIHPTDVPVLQARASSHCHSCMVQQQQGGENISLTLNTEELWSNFPFTAENPVKRLCFEAVSRGADWIHAGTRKNLILCFWINQVSLECLTVKCYSVENKSSQSGWSGFRRKKWLRVMDVLKEKYIHL